MNNIDPLKLQKILGKRYFQPKIGESKRLKTHLALVPKIGSGFNPRQQYRYGSTGGGPEKYVVTDKNDSDEDLKTKSKKVKVEKTTTKSGRKTRPGPSEKVGKQELPTGFEKGEFGLGSSVKTEKPSTTKFGSKLEALVEHKRREQQFYIRSNDPIPEVGSAMRTRFMWKGKPVAAEWTKFDIKQVKQGRKKREQDLPMFEV